MMPYPTITDSSNASLMAAINQIARARLLDIADWNNLSSRFPSGQKVGIQPSIGSQYGFSANTNDATSCVAGSYTKMQFNLVDFDPSNCFDNVTNFRYTAPVTGYYQVNLVMAMDSVADGKLIAAVIYKNGVIYKQSLNTLGASVTDGMALSILMSLAATDYIEAYAYNGDASNRTIDVSGFSNHFSAYLTGV